ncbi:hypothetical protein IWX78_003077 [Mycetocola sp. CAN_C7]|uniref:hypothetical protein n=1 Tax=Mycetocola sp. CAN_C7 TaxID=2787724 RepID=UPI0018CA8198
MVAKHLLVMAAAAVAISCGFTASGGVAEAASDCDVQDKVYGFCTDSAIDGGEAIIRGDGETDGGGGNGGNGGGGGRDNSNGGNGGEAGPSVPSRDFECATGPLCAVEAITLSDLASFRPVAPTLSMEPDGWMLIGLPANFIARTQTHVVSGSLFSYPLAVRFTPSSYAWSWGDGTSSRSTVPGATWASLGLPEFSPTPTSHVYDDRGVYRISVTVSYTVEFRVASLPWRSIAGTLPGPATIVAALAGDAKTVLVEHECNRNPDGPGC